VVIGRWRKRIGHKDVQVVESLGSGNRLDGGIGVGGTWGGG
jgi:hypothetical protein